MKFNVIIRTPTINEYNELRLAVDWPTFDEGMVECGLANSLYSVVVEGEGKVVGMGRILGDNAIYFHIQDVIVRPEFQGQGLGKIIMDELLDYIDSKGGQNSNIGLMCSKGREPFYRTFGFIDRPNDTFGSGMIMIMQ
jgi:ribosomal protein S18 acetylase RimI-like enzyme